VQVSVIIPTLNEEEFIKPCLESLSFIDPDEVIVVDGGSRDRTVEIVKSFGVKVISSQPGRGKQLSLGAKLAQGDYLLFLHADCRFTKPVDIRRAIKEGFAWGFFPIKYEPTNLELKLLSAWINFRSKVFALPFGDQGLIVKRALYEEVGGFKDYPFLEDVDLVLRIRKKGRPKFFPVSLTVSSRKLKPRIPLYPTFHSLRNFVILLAFLLGCSPNLLAKFYK
jgi:rSAM/selenodomain-associated transferase 2